jgi:hypothetical protein
MNLEALRFETFKGIECLFPLGWNTQDQRVLQDLVVRQFGGFGVRDTTGTVLWGTAGALATRSKAVSA